MDIRPLALLGSPPDLKPQSIKAAPAQRNTQLRNRLHPHHLRGAIKIFPPLW
jgi:hypothetical protein